jgi:isoquinoline 1-oxidoreductase subunit beta
MVRPRGAGSAWDLSPPDPLRRRLVLGTGAVAAGLLIGLYPARRSVVLAQGGAPPLHSPFDAWVEIRGDGAIVLFVAKAEMGQGILTSLGQILAEELDVAWEKVHVQQARIDPNRYDHLTVGSDSVRSLYSPLRRAGAMARDALLRAAALRWKVLAGGCRTDSGVVVGPDGQRLTYADLAAQAATLPMAADVGLRDPIQFRLIGRSIPRIECQSKVTGTAVFGIDVSLPGMLHAVVARCPKIGGQLASFDKTVAAAVPGVRSIFPIPPVQQDAFTRGGIAIIASDHWSALKARGLLKVDWSFGNTATADTEVINSALHRNVSHAGRIVERRGDVPATLARAQNVVCSRYEVPFLAHATLEPQNATVEVLADRVNAWLPTQNAADARRAIAQLLKRAPESVTVHQMLLGGGFGRRDATDFPVEAAQVAERAGAPVKVLWTREDDFHCDRYRPAAVHLLQAALDWQGYPQAWLDRLSSVSIEAFLNPQKIAHAEATEVGGARHLPYAIPAFQLEYQRLECPVPVGWWRSVEDSINAFAVECFMDELAVRAGEDPLHYRLQLLPAGRTVPGEDDERIGIDRLRRVLLRVAEQAHWRPQRQSHTGFGIACHVCRGSYIAVIARVRVGNADISVEELWAAVDCGTVVNPKGVEAQIEGGLLFGCSAALHENVTFTHGSIAQSNFHDYRVLRLNESPRVSVEILASTEPPSGVGEIGVPAVAPALANAIFRATGQRPHTLPLRPWVASRKFPQ